jgi:hypothetical protein
MVRKQIGLVKLVSMYADAALLNNRRHRQVN